MKRADFARALEGQILLSAQVLEYWYNGQLMSAAAPVLLQLAQDRWLRFLFDDEEFFWRVVTEPDAPYDDGIYRYALRDISSSLSGRTVSKVQFETPRDDVAVLSISLAPSGRLVLRSE